MALPREEWLEKAKRLAVGGTKRIYHGTERRPNLVIQNKADRWSCWCHSCHEGGVVLKEHASLSVVANQARFMPWPSDARDLRMWPENEQLRLLGMLATKGIDLQVMCPDVPVWYSQEQRRLLFGTSLGWLGRATAGQQPKWTGYGYPAPVYGRAPQGPRPTHVVLTEDYLSALKVRWAVAEWAGWDAVAMLGTNPAPALLQHLSVWGCEVILALDGDAAGDRGRVGCLKRLRGLGLPVRAVQVPSGYDPKDMDKHELQALLGGTSGAANSSGVEGTPEVPVIDWCCPS